MIEQSPPKNPTRKKMKWLIFLIFPIIVLALYFGIKLFPTEFGCSLIGMVYPPDALGCVKCSAGEGWSVNYGCAKIANDVDKSCIQDSDCHSNQCASSLREPISDNYPRLNASTDHNGYIIGSCGKFIYENEFKQGTYTKYPVKLTDPEDTIKSSIQTWFVN